MQTKFTANITSHENQMKLKQCISTFFRLIYESTKEDLRVFMAENKLRAFIYQSCLFDVAKRV